MREYSTRAELAQWQKHAERAAAVVVDAGSGAAAAGGKTAHSTLSKLHISPQDWPRVIWSEGASLLKVSKGGHCEAPQGGPRGDIGGFSDDSRRRLLYTIGQVRRDAPLPMFVTLTYPEAFPTARESKRHLDAFNKRIRRAFPQVGYIWKLEPQERGAPHYHMLMWGVELTELRGFIPFAWFDIAGGGDQRHLLWHLGMCGNGNTICVNAVRTWRGVWSYAAKYLGKTFVVAGWEKCGRYWAVVSRKNIPFGTSRSVEVSRSVACHLQRYQRRFARMKKQHGRTVTIFCDADQWIRNTIALDTPSGAGASAD